jgi:hypothetical protein
MAPAADTTTHRPPASGLSGPSRELAAGTLGSRLLRMAQMAAAVHMAESALPRTPGAQTRPGAEGPR